MAEIITNMNTPQHPVEHGTDAKALFGFWVYIMSDCLLFASIFAAYAVLHNNNFEGVSAHTLFDMPFVLIETLILLTSSFTYGLVSLYSHHHNHKGKVLFWLGVTGILGATFLAMEVSEFTKFISEGNGPAGSAFLSSFFTLVGTHGLHVTAGLIWLITIFIQVYRDGVTPRTLSKLSLLGLFWHFLDIIWIFIFTIVYLMAAI